MIIQNLSGHSVCVTEEAWLNHEQDFNRQMRKMGEWARQDIKQLERRDAWQVTGDAKFLGPDLQKLLVWSLKQKLHVCSVKGVKCKISTSAEMLYNR